MVKPIVECLVVGDTRAEYKITGGTLEPSWAESHAKYLAREDKDEAPWCEFSIWYDGNQIGSYGGTVWPTAWPELFASLPPSAQLGSARVIVLPAGCELLAKARRQKEAR